MEQNIQNNIKLDKLFRELINASNIPFSFIIRSPMYKNKSEEELAFSSYIQPNCQPEYNDNNRYLH